jgi:hypothetical protein
MGEKELSARINSHSPLSIERERAKTLAHLAYNDSIFALREISESLIR